MSVYLFSVSPYLQMYTLYGAVRTSVPSYLFGSACTALLNPEGMGRLRQDKLSDPNPQSGPRPHIHSLHLLQSSSLFPLCLSDSFTPFDPPKSLSDAIADAPMYICTCGLAHKHYLHYTLHTSTVHSGMPPVPFTCHSTLHIPLQPSTPAVA